MEYHCTKAQSVSVRIFELALKKFGDNPEFVLRYLGFLISINDDASTSLPLPYTRPFANVVEMRARCSRGSYRLSHLRRRARCGKDGRGMSITLGISRLRRSLRRGLLRLIPQVCTSTPIPCSPIN